MSALLSQSVNWGSVVRRIVVVRVKYVCATKERFVCVCCGGRAVWCVRMLSVWWMRGALRTRRHPSLRLLAGAFGNTEHVRKSLKWRVLKY